MNLTFSCFFVNIQDMNKEIINTKKIKRNFSSLFLLSFMSMSSLHASNQGDSQKQKETFSNRMSGNSLYKEIKNPLKMGQFKISNIQLSNKIKKTDVDLLLKAITEEIESINLEISKLKDEDANKKESTEELTKIKKVEEIVKQVKEALTDSEGLVCTLKFGATHCGAFNYLGEEEDKEDPAKTKCLVIKKNIGSIFVTGFYFFASGGIIYFFIKYFSNNNSSSAEQED